MVRTLTQRDRLKRTIDIREMDERGYLDPVFTCKGCGETWEPSWDAEGNWLIESYYCPKKCNEGVK